MSVMRDSCRHDTGRGEKGERQKKVEEKSRRRTQIIPPHTSPAHKKLPQKREAFFEIFKLKNGGSRGEPIYRIRSGAKPDCVLLLRRIEGGGRASI